MINKILMFCTIALMSISLASSGHCTDWLYFIESGKGEKYYIDLDSMKRSPENIVSITRKIEYIDSSNHTYLISTIEMDCEKVMMRILSENAYGQEGLAVSSKSPGDWQAVNPEGIDESLYELACSLQKKHP